MDNDSERKAQLVKEGLFSSVEEIEQCLQARRELQHNSLVRLLSDETPIEAAKVKEATVNTLTRLRIIAGGTGWSAISLDSLQFPDLP